MIVHTGAKYHNGGTMCFCLLFCVYSAFDCHITVKCDFSLIGRKSTRITDYFFLFCTNVTRIRSLASKMSQKYDQWMICHTAETLLQAQKDTPLQKVFFFFFFFVSLNSHHHYVNSNFYKSRLAP